MAAPTPVSAYLHSATMVKAGIFLMARLWPVLSGTWTGSDRQSHRASDHAARREDRAFQG
jgi:formate hydrogenlyase subunit 3/multisubunit Na+/H+ antiporter MnhD subunit